MAADSSHRSRALSEVFDRSARARLLGKDWPSAASAVALSDAGDAAIAFDLAYYLPDDLLVKVDVATMRYGLESRCPFLDHALADAVIPLSIDEKVSKDTNKILLRRAVEDLLPRRVTARPKRGFGSPVEQWLSGALKETMMERVAASDSPLLSYLDRSEVRRICLDAAAGKGNAHQAWGLLALDSWLRQNS